MNEVVIYTDGGAEPNPGRGGYGVVLQSGTHMRELSGGFALTTNNRMELMAVIVALESLDERCHVKLHSDSQYVIQSITTGSVFRWRANDWGLNVSRTKLAKNADLWERLLQAYERHQVELFWVKGHAGIEDNERCDRLATAAIRGEKLPADEGYHGAPPPQAKGKTRSKRVETRQRKMKTTVGKRAFTPPASTVMLTESGEPCTKCQTPVIKKASRNTALKPNQSSYYAWLLYCPNCHAHYIVEKARREVVRSGAV